MACHFGTVAVPASTGNVTVTGIPFEPVAVIFFGGRGDLTDPTNYIGAATSSTDQWAAWTAINSEITGYDERVREMRDDVCMYSKSDSTFSTINYAASMVAMTSDGFTVNFFSNVTGGNVDQFYLALGGQNISAAHAGVFTCGLSTGTTTVTDPGFEPSALIVVQQLLPSVNVQQSHMCWGLGFTDGTNSYSSFAAGDALSATAGKHIHRTDAVACGTFGGADYRLEFDSWDPSGFVVDVTDAWASNNVHGYLAIDCATAAVGNALVPDSTGTQTYATAGFEPAGVLFGWNGADTPSTTGSTGMPVRPGVGAMDGYDDPSDTLDREEGAVSMIHRASAPFGAYVPDAFIDGDLCINIAGTGSQVDPGATALISGAEWSAFNMGNFVIDWTTTTTNDRHFGWLALPGDLPINWIPQIYRRQPV